MAEPWTDQTVSDAVAIFQWRNPRWTIDRCAVDIIQRDGTTLKRIVLQPLKPTMEDLNQNALGRTGAFRVLEKSYTDRYSIIECIPHTDKYDRILFKWMLDETPLMYAPLL